MSRPETVISVNGLRKTYRGITAVDGISFEAYRGEILGILGPNGSGKTTTLKSVLGLIFYDGGSVRVLGLDPRKDRKRILRSTGAMLEGARNVYWQLSPDENLEYFAGIKGLSRRDIRERRNKLVAQLGLEDVRRKELREFSNGMKQKTALACAFINDPELLMLDEPTLGLDVEITIQIGDLLRASVRDDGRSMLVTSHDMDFMESVCDRVLIIKKGRILSHETLDSLRCRFSRKTFRLELDRSPGTEAMLLLRSLGDVEPFDSDASCTLKVVLKDAGLVYGLMDALRADGLRIMDLSTVESDLEDIFLQMIRDDADAPA
jgi:ABC-2 type transport system ATP-binding protein